MMLLTCLLMCSPMAVRIDTSRDDGSFGRLSNDEHRHPNCRMKKIDVNGNPHLCLLALNDIKDGEEITYDYGGEDCPWRTEMTSTAAESMAVDGSQHSPLTKTQKGDEGQCDSPEQVTRFSFPGSKEQTELLIQLRGENDHLFTGAKHSSAVGWRTILEKMGLGGTVEPQQAKKKWDNLKKRYKVGAGVDFFYPCKLLNTVLKIADVIDYHRLRIVNIQGQERGPAGSPLLLPGPGLSSWMRY
ncbi:unnamed protein product [Scomber scombrus]|uniref:Unnamed protein product n=1 Tax=Scomber scombrus TaxID=13677 RepID=A0AAV1P7X6_SCOSC